VAARASGIRAGRAYVEVGADDAPLQARIKAAEARIKAFGASVSAVGGKLLSLGKAAGLQILGGAGLAKLFADAGSELNDMSARTGLSVEALSQLGYAAKQTGTDLGTVESAVRKMQKSLVGAANGSFEAQAALALLGLSAEKLLKLSPDDQFQAIAKAMAAIPDPTMKAALAMQLFGNGGTAILPLIDDFDALTGKARDLGLVMSAEDAAAADALGDAIDTVSASLRRAVNVIGGAMAPALTFVADRISETVKAIADWIAANRGLVQILAAVVPGAVALGAAMVVLGPVISAVGVAVGALASPMVVVLGLAAGLGSVLVQTSGVAAEAFGWLSERLGELLADARSAFQGIADALAAGDIGLAAKVLWAELRLEWVKGVSFLRKIWLDFSSAFRDVFAAAVSPPHGGSPASTSSIKATLMRGLPRSSRTAASPRRPSMTSCRHAAMPRSMPIKRSGSRLRKKSRTLGRNWLRSAARRGPRRSGHSVNRRVASRVLPVSTCPTSTSRSARPAARSTSLAVSPRRPSAASASGPAYKMTSSRSSRSRPS
jgi:hypothetical protein